MGNLYATILAGGSGTRLWPRSRESTPKQFLDFTGTGTMLQEAFSRVAPIIPPERVWILTGKRYVDTVREQLPVLPPENVVGEPVGRGTAPAIGFAAMLLQRESPNAVMAVLTADHVINYKERFREVLLEAAQVAEKGHLVTLGIKPSRPDTGYGYIERGEKLYDEKFPVYRVVRFTEKPNLEMAEQFVASGNYSWNSGMFIWRVDAILAEIERQMPELFDGLKKIMAAWDEPKRYDVLQSVWPKLPNETIDFGVMEHAKDVVVIPVEIGWSDVGSWNALWEVLPHDPSGNVVQGNALLHDVENSLIYSESHLIAAVGIRDMVIVDSGDAVLVIPRSRSQEVKTIVNALKQRGLNDYLL